MPSDEVKAVKLMRSPVDTRCASEDCQKELPFGSWVYYHSETLKAICPECAVKKGWMPKDRVELIIGKLELKEDLKALKHEKQVLADNILLLKQQVDVYRLGERDLQLGGEISRLMKTVEDYLKQCGTVSEKEGLKKVFDAILECKDLQQEVREQIESHLFMFRRKERKKTEYQIPEEED